MQIRSRIVAALSVLMLVPVGVPSATAAIPIYPVPTIVEIDRIVTNPFVGSTATEVVGDAEGLTRDPVRNTLWLADDKNGILHEIDLVTRKKVGEITKAQFVATPNFVDGTPAGTNRIGDNEGIAYDNVTDSMYVFSGPCCSVSPHTPTVYRLKRPSPGAAFVPETYQRLEDQSPNDFGAADVMNGLLYTSYRDPVRGWNQVHTFDYVTRTLSAPIAALREVSGWVSSLAFSDDGTDLWVTSTSNNLYRYHVPSYTLVPGHSWGSVYAFGKTRDARAIEIIDDLLYVADGYDGHSDTSPSAFAIHIWQVTGVAGPPVASFTTDPANPAGPAPLSIRFSDTSAGLPTDWLWEWGDGTTNSTGRAPNHTFTTPGTYTVRLTATNAIGSSQATRMVTVSPQVGTPPTANFDASATVGNAPLNVQFTNNSTGSPAPTFLWTFGTGGPTSTAANPSHQFAIPGTFTVTLTATNAHGTSSVNRTVTVNSAVTAPVAAFQASTLTGVAPLTVQFTSTSTGAPQPTLAWNFGDSGASETTANPTRTFATPGTYDIVLRATNSAGSTTATRQIVVSTPPPPPPPTTQPPPPTPPPGFAAGFVGLSPIRLLDTRRAPTIDGESSGGGPVGPGRAIQVRVTGRGGVPAAGAGAVALNVTAVGPTAESYVTVWPTGNGRPTASNLNLSPGRTTPNMVVVKVGTDGSVSLYNDAGDTDLIVDLLGWFPDGTGFAGVNPARVLDTRSAPTVDGRASGGGALGPRDARAVPIAGRAGIPEGAGAVAVNVTAVGATASTYLTAYASGASLPTASNLNVVPGRVAANMVVLPVGPDGRIMIYNDAGSVDVLIDVLGWFPADSGFMALSGARLTDSRPTATIDGLFADLGPLAPDTARSIQVTGRGGVPSTGVGAVVLNVTALDASATSYLTVWPTGSDRPTASNLNVAPGDTTPNLVIVPVGAGGRVSFYNDAGTTGLIVDVLGWFPTAPAA